MKRIIGYQILAVLFCGPSIVCAIASGEAWFLLIPIALLLAAVLVTLAVKLITESETPNVD